MSRAPMTMDGMYRRRAPAPRAAKPVPPPPALPPIRVYAKQTAQVRAARRLPQWLQIILTIPLLLLTPFFIQSAALGQTAIVVYGIAAFIYRVPSKTNFAAALLCMLTTIVLLVVKGNIALAQDFAIYTFLLLVVGVITLSRELKKEGGRIYSRRT